MKLKHRKIYEEYATPFGLLFFTQQNEADINLLKSEVERLTNENRRLKEELSIRTSQSQARMPASSTSVDKPARSRNSPVKVCYSS